MRTSLLVMIAATLASCSSTTGPTPRDEFPDDVGTRWRYAVYDSLARRLDTATVEIVGTITLPGIPEAPPAYGSLWVVRLRERADTFVVAEAGGTYTMESIDLSRSGGDGLLQLFGRLEFPLSLGKAWQHRSEHPGFVYGRDSVTEHALIQTSDARTVEEFTVHGSWSAADFSGGDESIGIVPGVGMVSMRYHQWSHLPVVRIQTWRLIEPSSEKWYNP